MIDKKLKLTVPWDEIDEKAKLQIKNALSVLSLSDLAIMRDVHGGYDLPIGAVAVLDNEIWPGAVGYDIGCGMCHINTGKKINEIPDLMDVFARMQNLIPVGFRENLKPRNDFEKFPNASKIAAIREAINYKAGLQLGTLGGGNHFIEIGVNSEGQIGITIHSGSRRPGWLIADYWMKVSGGPTSIDDYIGEAYYKDMQWALNFALQNRSIMMQHCLNVLHLGSIDRFEMINENHNHASIMSRGIVTKVIHRKGATPAEKDQLGIIPINMRDGVYITRGLGNKEFLCSASHGAGRVLSRKKARESFTVDSLKHQMNGILTPSLNNLLDESPDSYKDHNYVLRGQSGVLVDVIDHFKPLLVLKG